MADVGGARPHPPGEYPITIVGSGPGGLQMAYLLRRSGINFAHISRDPEPGGMFRTLPVFDRLLSWSKPAPAPGPGVRGQAWYDWNLLLADDAHRVAVTDLMSSPGIFPSRQELSRALAAFAERSRLSIRYQCLWTGTRLDQGRFVLETTDGEYRSKVVVLATGMSLPWLPKVPGIEHAIGYADVGDPDGYRNRRVLIIGKENSGFEIADELLPYAGQVVVAGPGPTRFTITTGSFAGSRARFDQTYEDHVVGGGSAVLDASISSIQTKSGQLLVDLRLGEIGRPLPLVVDDVVAATGFTGELGDLRSLGLQTFARDRLPAQTLFWESASIPGIYFAGTLTQAARGLRKHGVPSTSASIQGFRYNAQIQARHIAEQHFGVTPPRSLIDPPQLGGFLLRAASRSAALMSQKGYLARVVAMKEGELTDSGLQPLTAFLDGEGSALAVAVEVGPDRSIQPVVYLRQATKVSEHILDPHPLHDYQSDDHARQLDSILAGWPLR